MFSKILGVEIKPDPILIIIGVSEWLGKLQVAQKRLISYGLFYGLFFLPTNFTVLEKERSAYC